MSCRTTHYPDIISAPRFTTVLVSLLVTLGSGTNYVYSAYAPQLGARLNISHTHLNFVGLAGNIGVYSTGPIWGRIVDTHGPRIPMASAFILLLTGYAGIKFIFDAGVPANSNSNSISLFTSCVLVLCGFMTGAGGNAGMTGAVNSTAKTFPDQTRATATGLVISGFGLSAFLFSTISRIYFPGNTSSFLGLLALGTSLPMIAGFFFVRPIPLPSPSSSLPSDRSIFSGAEEGTRIEIGSRNSRDSDIDNTDDEHEHDGEQSALLPLASSSTPPSQSPTRHPSPTQNPTPNVHSHKLFTSPDFWLLFSILSILAGTGLTYINNAGLMSQALYIHSLHQGGAGGTYDPIKAAHWQADQVASISLLNFAGRIVIGLTTDTLKHTLSLPRSSSLLLVSLLFFLSQALAALVVHDVEHLWIVSATLGLAHGSVFSLMPNVCLEWFGIAHFSENWGYLSIAPILFGNIFAIVFGRTLDAHDRASPSSPSPPSSASHNITFPSLLPRASSALAPLANTTAPPVPPPSTCTLGRKCYVDALYLTLFACSVGVVLSAWAGWRDWRRGRGWVGGRWGR